MGTAGDIIGLDGEELLERIRRTVSLHRPDLHLPETLSTELRLPTERLLGDEAVRTSRAGVDLVIDEVVELKDVHHPDSDRIIKASTGLSIKERTLCRAIQTCELEGLVEALLGGAIEDRRRDVDAAINRLDELLEVFPVHLIDHALMRRLSVVTFELRSEELLVIDRFEHLIDLLTQPTRSPAEVRLEDLADVHPARDAERVEDHIDRGHVFEERHILDREDARDDTLIPVTTCHLVTDAELPLDRDIDLDHLPDAWREIIALTPLLDERLMACLDRGLALFELLEEELLLLRDMWIFDLKLWPELFVDLLQDLFGQRLFRLTERAALLTDEALDQALADEDLFESVVVALADDVELFLLVLLDLGELCIFEVLLSPTLLCALPAEDLCIDDCPDNTWGDAERGVPNFTVLLTEDRAEESVLWLRLLPKTA